MTIVEHFSNGVSVMCPFLNASKLDVDVLSTVLPYAKRLNRPLEYWFDYIVENIKYEANLLYCLPNNRFMQLCEKMILSGMSVLFT